MAGRASSSGKWGIHRSSFAGTWADRGSASGSVISIGTSPSEDACRVYKTHGKG